MVAHVEQQLWKGVFEGGPGGPGPGDVYLDEFVFYRLCGIKICRTNLEKLVYKFL